MIAVTRLDGEEIVVNAELIESIESVPETVLVLVTKRRLMVREPVDEVVRRVVAYRRALLATVTGAGLLPEQVRLPDVE
jgi:flagellar protein FlbD